MILGGEGGNSFPFDNVGDSVTGLVRSMREVQQTDLDTGQPATWPDGRPKTMIAVELATDLREGDGDDGARTVYLRGSIKPESQSSLAAVRSAVKAVTGGYALHVGGRLTLSFVGEEPAQKRGYSPRKLYSASYVAPSVDLEQSKPAATPATPAAAPAAPSPAPATATGGGDVLGGLTPEQRLVLGITDDTPAEAAWDDDPRVAPLRAAGVADEKIRAALGI